MRMGELHAHDQLPSEHELSRIFSVSRSTVRQALQSLEADGLIYRRQGLGSFVCDRRVAQGLVHLTDFAQDMQRAGIRALSRILRQEIAGAVPEVAEALGVEAGTPVYRLDRLRLGDGEPIALDLTWLPPAYGRLLEGHDLTTLTLYQLLEGEYAIPILSGRYRLSAVAAGPEEAQVLAIHPGDPLLLIERTSRTLEGRPVYVQRRYYRPDRIVYEIEAARDSDSGASALPEEGLPLREFEAVFLRAPSRLRDLEVEPIDPDMPIES